MKKEKNFNYYGIQLSYTLKSDIGIGNYKAILNTTSEDFLDPKGSEYESLSSLLLSFDQELGKLFGVWLRLGWAIDDAAIEWEELYSGGINLKGSKWHRPYDNIGIGYAYLKGGNTGIDNSQVFETFYRCGIKEYFSATADIQYMKDRMLQDANPDGWIFGIRLTAEM